MRYKPPSLKAGWKLLAEAPGGAVLQASQNMRSSRSMILSAEIGKPH